MLGFHEDFCTIEVFGAALYNCHLLYLHVDVSTDGSWVMLHVLHLFIPVSILPSYGDSVRLTHSSLSSLYSSYICLHVSVFCPGFQKGRVPSEKGTLAR